MNVPPFRRRWILPGLIVAAAGLLLGAGAAAAFESDTVDSYWGGLWWAVSLMTTVGFVGEAPTGLIGQLVSTFLMVSGFLLLSLISAALASLFVREDEAPAELRERAADLEILARLDAIARRLDALEEHAGHGPAPGEDPPRD